MRQKQCVNKEKIESGGTAPSSSQCCLPCVPITVFSGLRPMHSVSGHLATRKELANMTWQYSLGLHSFLVALGRMPGITLCVQDCRARCPGLRNKNICQSHRVVGCLSSPTENSRTVNCQTVSRICLSPCPWEGHQELQKPSPRVSQCRIKCTYLPHYKRQVDKNSGAEARPLLTPVKTSDTGSGPFLDESQATRGNMKAASIRTFLVNFVFFQ